jgi:hypothetical protein
MSSIKLRSHVGEDGILHLDLPVGITDTDLEVTVKVETIAPQSNNSPQGKGWPPGFFEETFGCLKEEPLIIDGEGIFDDEEKLE